MVSPHFPKTRDATARPPQVAYQVAVVSRGVPPGAETESWAPAGVRSRSSELPCKGRNCGIPKRAHPED